MIVIPNPLFLESFALNNSSKKWQVLNNSMLTQLVLFYFTLFFSSTFPLPAYALFFCFHFAFQTGKYRFPNLQRCSVTSSVNPLQHPFMLWYQIVFQSLEFSTSGSVCLSEVVNIVFISFVFIKCLKQPMHICHSHTVFNTLIQQQVIG